MADSRYPQGQDEQHIFHPQLPPQVNPIQPGGQGSSAQGPPKMSGMPPPPMPGPPYQGVAPAPHMMPAGAAPGQAPLPPFSYPPSGAAGLPPPAGANSVNGYVPPGPQGPLPQGPAGVFRPPGPPQPSGGGPFPPAGSVGPAPGQNVPHSSYSGPFPPSGVGQTVNGKNTPPLVPSTLQPMIGGQPPSRFPQPGPVGGPPRLPVFSSQPPAGGGPAPPRMLAPPPGTGSAPSPVPANATLGSGLLSPPTELPIPFHGQAQYSHQVGATMKITPNPTPNNSEPPSQRSSRDPSPVNEQTFDAMEGQFSPSQGASSPRPGSRGSNRGSPFPGPGTPGSQSPFLPGQGKGTPPPSGQTMTPPPRPGMGGSPGVGGAPPPGSSVGTRPPGPPALGQPRPGYNPMAPYPGSGFQPGAPPRPPGPPTGVQGYPPGPASGPGPYHQGPPGPPGQGSGLQGPPPSGPQPGPFNLGHPTSGQGSGPPSAPYSLGPPRPGQGPPHAGPPSGPFQGPPTGPLQGPPTGPPSGPLQGPPSGPPSGPFQPGPAAGASSGPVNMGRPVPGGQAGGFYQPPPPTSQGMMAGPPFGPPSGPTGPMGPPAGPTGPLSGHTGPPSGLTGGASGPRGPYSQPGPGQGYPQPGPGQGYPQPGPGQGYPQPAMGAVNNLAGDFNKMGVNDSQRTINLMQEKRLIPPDGLETARPSLYHDHKRVNCNPDVFRCTINAIPQTSSLLNKSRLPLGILIHPFKDLSQLPVIQSSVIVRCRSCRSYINPFVTFVDQRRWKCNLCFRVNDLPDEFSFDPVTKSYGDPQRRPEIRSATIEFIAPSEYMLRPPQPAVYLFVLDVSFNAIETGYLRMFTQTLIEELDRIPGDARAQIGFICFDRSLYFFNLSEGLSQPQMMVMPDLEDVFLPCPDSLMVNMHERRDMVMELLNQLPTLFEGNQETGNALGSALQAAFKLLTSTGGRVTVVQTTLPTVGPGALGNREAASKNASLNVCNLGPASDFYKKLALDCSAQQVAVDLFMLNGQYADLASVSCISKYSAGCVQYYPAFHTLRNPAMTDKLESDLRRYLTRKIGFEAVMRIRCTRGISIHTFHGNFFVRSTDLLSLPNVNPDAGFGMQMSIEENLTESSNICFQAALLYTSSKGERRIRVHSLCVPVTNQLSDVFGAADQQAIASLLAKMAVDRTISSSLEDARDAMMNACQDMMNAYATQIPAGQRAGALMAPFSMRLIPLFTQAMLKSVALRLSANIRVDERVFAHLLAKCLPSAHLIQTFYPHLYPVHGLNDQEVVEHNKENSPKAPRLQLSSANVDRHGVYVMDQGESMYLMVGGAVPDSFCQSVFNAPNFTAIPEGLTDLPELENPTSERLRSFIGRLMDSRPGGVSFLVLREDSKARHLFFQYMVEDRTENSKSYYEFLQFIQQKVKG